MKTIFMAIGISAVVEPSQPSDEGACVLVLPLALDFAQSEHRSLIPATHAISLVQPKPRAVRELLIVPSIGSREIACTQRSGIRHREDALKPFDFSNRLLGVHPPQ